MALTRGQFMWPKFQWISLTYEAHVDDFVAVQEVGRVINPVLATGTNRRRRRAGHWFYSLRKCRLAKRAHGKRSDDELHHAYGGGHSADSRLL